MHGIAFSSWLLVFALFIGNIREARSFFYLENAAARRMTMAAESEEKPRLPRRKFVDLLVAGSFLYDAPTPAFADALPKTGVPAPDFLLPSNAGKDLALKDFTGKGKWTVLYFYPGDFTEGCTIEAKGFQANMGKFDALNAQIVGVSVDDISKHLDFAKTYGLSYPLLSDLNGKVSSTYGSILKIPFLGTFSNRQTYIIDPEGNLRYVFTDVESRVKRHADDIMSKLTELQKSPSQAAAG